ncbi:MAG: hypothetical protein JXQ83_12540 [Candidatus Glassbacteria bacterium]|nr:hypothetical protein [Candidatus Glassbacteria bacterium]
MFTVILFVTLAILVILYFLVRAGWQDSRLKILRKLHSLENFSPSEVYLSPGILGTVGIAVDKPGGKVCLIKKYWNVYFAVYDAWDILAAEVLVDGKNITRTSSGLSLGGAALGGILGGSLGALICGYERRQEVIPEVKKVELHLTVRDARLPSHYITFLNQGTAIDSSLLEEAVGQAGHWYDLIRVMAGG